MDSFLDPDAIDVSLNVGIPNFFAANLFFSKKIPPEKKKKKKKKHTQKPKKKKKKKKWKCSSFQGYKD